MNGIISKIPHRNFYYVTFLFFWFQLVLLAYFRQHNFELVFFFCIYISFSRFFFYLLGGLRVNNGKAYNFEVKCMQKEIGIYRMPLFVSFIYEADQSTKQIAREILLKVTNADVEFIKPTTVGF